MLEWLTRSRSGRRGGVLRMQLDCCNSSMLGSLMIESFKAAYDRALRAGFESMDVNGVICKSGAAGADTLTGA